MIISDYIFDFSDLLLLRQACRLCRTSDYETVVGECRDGQQQVHYLNPRGCIISADGRLPIDMRACSVIPKQLQVGIVVATALAIFLVSLLVHFWKQNRRLEYKYCKLIENEKQVENCCVDEEEADDEEDNNSGEGERKKGERRRQAPEDNVDFHGGGQFESIRLTRHHSEQDDVL